MMMQYDDAQTSPWLCPVKRGGSGDWIQWSAAASFLAVKGRRSSDRWQDFESRLQRQL
jgi:hypothetical protein